MSTFPMCLRFGRKIIDGRVGLVKTFHTIHCRNIGSLHMKYSTSPVEEQKASDPSPVDIGKQNQPNQDSQTEDLIKSVQDLTKQRDELSDKYKRSLADGENMRKRLMKQIDEAKLFGIQSFCKDLLEVADILGKATECVPKEEVTDRNPHLKNLYEGLTLTEAQLQKVFKRHGLLPVNPLNEKFDPNLHEALFQQEVEGKDAGTVVVVSKIGYKLHERVVRPALVGVAKG